MINIGSETDTALFKRLKTALRSMGSELVETSWGVGGSQLVITYEAALPKGVIEIVSETYMGVLVRGSADLVQSL